ncbi:MAG TPA: 50S ribosomal protein L5 [Candidatus Paceibacterota bacterium]|nr:50S ribosomal protein L5 [Candidatus Paceibacterota bacterium]
MAEKTNTNRKAVRAFVEKVVLDAGVGRLAQQPNFEEKILPQVMRDIAAITGQQPQVRKAKESIAGFKVREGTIVGLRVTLRRGRAVDFFERLITIVLPRVRDFVGLEHSAIDQGGTLNVGIRDHYVFPEISPEKSPVSFALGVSVVPKTRNHAKSVEKFAEFGVPMKKGAPAPKGKGKKKK